MLSGSGVNGRAINNLCPMKRTNAKRRYLYIVPSPLLMLVLGLIAMLDHLRGRANAAELDNHAHECIATHDDTFPGKCSI